MPTTCLGFNDQPCAFTHHTKTQHPYQRTNANYWQAYVRYFNGLYQRTGILWEGRFKSAVIDSEHYLLTCYCYIEQNPLRTDMVVDISQYP